MIQTWSSEISKLIRLVMRSHKNGEKVPYRNLHDLYLVMCEKVNSYLFLAINNTNCDHQCIILIEINKGRPTMLCLEENNAKHLLFISSSELRCLIIFHDLFETSYQHILCHWSLSVHPEYTSLFNIY